MPIGDIESATPLSVGLADLGQQLHDGLEPGRGEVHGHKAAIRPHGVRSTHHYFSREDIFPGSVLLVSSSRSPNPEPNVASK